MPHELNASIQVARHYSLWATFRSTADATAEAPKSEAEFVVNVDGSVWRIGLSGRPCCVAGIPRRHARTIRANDATVRSAGQHPGGR